MSGIGMSGEGIIRGFGTGEANSRKGYRGSIGDILVVKSPHCRTGQADTARVFIRLTI